MRSRDPKAVFILYQFQNRFNIAGPGFVLRIYLSACCHEPEAPLRQIRSLVVTNKHRKFTGNLRSISGADARGFSEIINEMTLKVISGNQIKCVHLNCLLRSATRLCPRHGLLGEDRFQGGPLLSKFPYWDSRWSAHLFSHTPARWRTSTSTGVDLASLGSTVS